MDPDANQQRRLSAKRTNERVKLICTTINALAIGVVGATFIVPGAAAPASLLEFRKLIWLLAAAALHGMALVTVGWLRSED